MNDENGNSNPNSGATIRDYLELMRLPNVFTSMADVAMGFLFVRELATAADAWLLAFLLASSSLLISGGRGFKRRVRLGTRLAGAARPAAALRADFA